MLSDAFTSVQLSEPVNDVQQRDEDGEGHSRSIVVELNEESLTLGAQTAGGTDIRKREAAVKAAAAFKPPDILLAHSTLPSSESDDTDQHCNEDHQHALPRPHLRARHRKGHPRMLPRRIRLGLGGASA